MSIKKFPSLEWARFERRLKSPFRFGERELNFREGIYLRARVGDRAGYGEAAPLAGVSAETLADVESWISRGEAALWEAWRDPNSTLPASLRFALDSAAAELEAEASSHPVRANALLSPGSPGWERNVDALWAKGFRCFKLKITPALAESALALLEYLKEKADSAYKIRLDANQSFLPNNILETTPLLFAHPIDYWEDPLPYSDPWSWKYFRKESPFSIAVDGPIVDYASLQAALDGNMADVFILKPSVLGGFSLLDRAFALLEPQRKRLVVTSTLETEVGLRAIANYLGRRPEIRWAHGIASGSIFEEFFYEEKPEWTPDFQRTPKEVELLRAQDWRAIG